MPWGDTHKDCAGTFSPERLNYLNHRRVNQEIAPYRTLSHPIAPYRTLSHPIAVKKVCEQGAGGATAQG
jgi:hypothetical protein